MVNQRKPALRVFSINDVYTFAPTNGHGGFATANTLLQTLRDEADRDGVPYLVTCNGDFLGGSSLTVKTNGQVAVDVLNHMDIDVVTIGNHEFDYGPDALVNCIAESKFLWLGANIIEKATQDLLKGVSKYTVVEAGGIRVGCFGVCTRATPHISYPGDGIEFLSPIEVARECVEALKKENVDVIIAVTHLVLKEDKELLTALPDVDILLGGHDHDPFALLHHGSLLFKCGQNAYWVGSVDVFIDEPSPTTDAKPHKFYSWNMHTTFGVEQDPKITEIVARHRKAADHAEMAANEGLDLDEELCRLDSALVTTTANLRSKETNSACILADAMFDYYAENGMAPDLASLNGGFVRGDHVYVAGTMITNRIIKEELPFPRLSCIIEIPGEKLWGSVEQQLRFLPEKSGSFPHFSKSVRIEVDAGKLPGSRIVSFVVNGEPLDKAKKYRVVVTEFVANGGDGCSDFAFGVQQKGCEGLEINQIATRFFRSKESVAPACEGRLTFV